jgi:hypothetical protein
MVKVKDNEHFRSLLKRGATDFRIVLGGGGLVSRKQIREFPGLRKYEVFHAIDGTIQTLSWRDLLRETNIGVALRKGCFYAEKV